MGESKIKALTRRAQAELAARKAEHPEFKVTLTSGEVVVTDHEGMMDIVDGGEFTTIETDFENYSLSVEMWTQIFGAKERGGQFEHTGISSEGPSVTASSGEV